VEVEVAVEVEVGVEVGVGIAGLAVELLTALVDAADAAVVAAGDPLAAGPTDAGGLAEAVVAAVEAAVAEVAGAEAAGEGDTAEVAIPREAGEAEEATGAAMVTLGGEWVDGLAADVPAGLSVLSVSSVT